MPAILCLLLALCSACGVYEENSLPDTPLPPSEGALPPMVFVDDVLFITPGSLLNPTLDESWIFLGEVKGYVSDMPAEHLHTNFNSLYVRGEMIDIIGVGRVYWSPNAAFPVWSPDVATSPPRGTVTVYGCGVIIDLDGQHFHFASVDTRERMEDILFGRLPAPIP